MILTCFVTYFYLILLPLLLLIIPSNCKYNVCVCMCCRVLTEKGTPTSHLYTQNISNFQI